MFWRQLAFLGKEGFEGGYSTGWITYWPTVTKLPLFQVERKSLPLEGVIVDTSDRPVEGALVCVSVHNPDLKHTTLSAIGVKEFSSITDVKGRFCVDGLPLRTEAELCVMKDGYATTYSFRTDRNLHRSLRPGQGEIKLLLKKEASLSGVLLRSDTNQPLSGEKISIVRNQGKGSRLFTHNLVEKTVTVARTIGGADSKTAVTDAEGRFSFDHLMPGDFTMFHHNADYSEKGLFSKKIRVVLEEGQSKVMEYPVTAGWPFELDGVVFPDGKPAVDVRLVLTRESEEGTAGFAFFRSMGSLGDSQGRFRYSIPPGKYKMSVGKGHELSEAGKVVTVPSATIETVHFTVKSPEEAAATKGVIKGICVDGEGTALKGVKVYLLSDTENSVYSDESGHFELSPRLDKCHEGVADLYERKQEEWADPGRMPVFIANNPMLFRRIEDQRNAADSWMLMSTVVVAEKGDKKLKAVKKLSNHMFLKNPETMIKLVLKPSCRITGRVVDEDGDPVADASVTVDILDREFISESLYRYEECVSDSDGRFSVWVHPENKYLITASREDGGSLSKHLSLAFQESPADMIEVVNFKGVSAKDARDFVVGPPVHKIAGVVTDYLGRPVRNARVRLASPSQGINEIILMTAGDGRFEFADLCRTQVEVSARYNEVCRYRTTAPNEHIRMILLDRDISDEDLGEKPAPSAAVELTITDASTGKPLSSGKLKITIQQQNGPSFQCHKPDNEGTIWMFVDAKGNGIAREGFNYYYIVNDHWITGPYAQTDNDGYFGDVPVVGGFDYLLRGYHRHIEFTRDFHVDDGLGEIDLGDCIVEVNY